MTLKLPKPLPRKYVDELIDATYEFTSQPYYDDPDLVRHSCIHRHLELHNYDRDIFELIDESYSSIEEDEEGYMTWGWSGSGMVWTAEWSDEETEEVLDSEICRL